MTDKLNNYIERHKGWQDKAIEQLSFANNFLLAISTGLLAYVFDKTSETLSKSTFCLCNCVFDRSMTLCSLSVFFLILSVMTGILVLISRLYDFRLTRHVTLVRKRFFEKNEDKVITGENKNVAVLQHGDFDYPKFWNRIKTILIILFIEIQFLTQAEMETSKSNFPKEKFKNIRELSFRLGAISWKWTKLQGLYFLIGTILYGLYLWTK